MKDWLSQRAALTPEHPALVFQDETILYAQMQEYVSGVCAQLFKYGLRPGDRAALHMPNSLETVLLVHALIRIGAVMVPLNMRLAVPEVAYQIEASRVDWLLAGRSTPPEILSLVPPSGLVLAGGLDFRGMSSPAWSQSEIDLAAPWGIIFTSGTTGKPKGAVLTYGNLYFSALSSAERLGLESAAGWLLALPLYHIGGLSIVLRCCLYGATVILHEKFDPRLVELSLDSGDVTLASLVPTMLQRILRSRGLEPFSPHLQIILLGGAAASPRLLADCLAAGIPIASTYGLSEAASQVATTTPQETAAKPGTVGKPLSGTDVRILDDQGQEAVKGQIGEIVVGGPTVMPGYLQNGSFPFISRRNSWVAEYPLPDNEDAVLAGLGLAEPPERFAWFHTGDLGYLDEDGDLWVVQRRSDLIVTGGENVYPTEVEQVLENHPGVEAAFVFGPPDLEWGQCVSALVVANAAMPVESDALLEFLRGRLAGYKVPRKIQFVESLPLTASGKIDRRRAAVLFKE